MVIYFTSFALICLVLLTSRNNTVIVIFFGLVAWFLAAFRDLNMGLFDTTGTYYLLFRNVYSSSFSEIATGTLGWESTCFGILTKCIQIFWGNNYQAYIAIISAFIIGCVCVAILQASKRLRWSPEVTFLACIIFGTFIYFYSYTMIRQIAALSILVAFAYPYLRNRELLKFTIVVLIASAIHSTALVFLPIYLICSFVRYRIVWFYVCLAIAIAGSVAPQAIMAVLNAIPILQTRMRYLAHGIYSSETAGVGYGTLIFLIALVAISLRYYNKCASTEISDLMWLITIGFVFQGWSHVVVEFYRVALYFTVFNMILIPSNIMSISTKKQRWFIICILTIIFLAYGGFVIADNTQTVNYQFCWNIGAWHQ